LNSNQRLFIFFGEAFCDGLEERLRKGETEIIDINRGGLEWDHEYCQSLSTAIEKILEPLVLEKKKILEKRPEKEIKESTKKMLKKLCTLLNELAKQELEEIEEPIEPTPNIENLVIKPEIANIQLDKPRIFSIYAPEDIIKTEGQKAYIRSDNIDIHPLASEVQLERHSKYPQIWYRYFKVVGRREGIDGFIEVKVGSEIAKAKVKVAPPKKKEKGEFTGRKGGFISDIIPDELPDPPQRVSYQNGIIKIYIKFPSVAKFIKEGFEDSETPEGRILLAELVGEAFCSVLAREKIESGAEPKVPGAEIDSFETVVDKMQKKYLHRIHEVISNWKFS
jgi:hypothetical protein